MLRTKEIQDALDEAANKTKASYALLNKEGIVMECRWPIGLLVAELKAKTAYAAWTNASKDTKYVGLDLGNDRLVIGPVSPELLICALGSPSSTYQELWDAGHHAAKAISAPE